MAPRKKNIGEYYKLLKTEATTKHLHKISHGIDVDNEKQDPSQMRQNKPH